MSSDNDRIPSLRHRIHTLESELADLKKQLLETEAAEVSDDPGVSVSEWTWPLDSEDYQRYGRQMIMRDIGLQGQLNLMSASVLVVGVGGLGCPAAAYLAGAGIGTLGLVDGDTVEVSNLHRQILHTADRVGLLKVDSAIEHLRQLNPKVHYKSYPTHLTCSTALDIFDKYDLILDCTDRPSSRYLISDATVVTGKPLVSASALRTEGQLMVLNNPPSRRGEGNGGFCYRCVFPTPPPSESVLSCGEGGILGPVVGVMGVLMAVEAVKIVIANVKPADMAAMRTAKPEPLDQNNQSLLLYSAFGNPPFRSIRLRGKRAHCPSCSADASITREYLTSGSLDYATFCGLKDQMQILDNHDRISAKKYSNAREESGDEPILIDVREEVQFNICHVPASVNIPFSDIVAAVNGNALSKARDSFFDLLERCCGKDLTRPIYCICRFGNDSQFAVQKFREWTAPHMVKGDIKGGLHAWRKEVDPTFPEY